jgi:serpin B
LNTTPFALALYDRLATSGGNFFFSPYSIAVALAMVQAGARGRTRQQIEAALGVPGGGDALLEKFGALSRELKRLGEAMPEASFNLTTANSLWHQVGYAVEPDFVTRVTRELVADVNEVDFVSQLSAAIQSINVWTAQATAGKIPSLVAQLDPLTRVLLANAIHFKSRWLRQFREENTRPEPFRLLDRRRVDVPTMHTEDNCEYTRIGSLQALRFPYANDWFALTLFVPDEGEFDAAGRFASPALARLGSRQDVLLVHLSLPRFRVESSFLLRDDLEALGIVDAFGPKADLSGVSTEPGFRLGQVIHKTLVEVDEQGTEAAAVTAVMMIGSALVSKRPKPLEFRVDRPFLFTISDRPTGTILFMGRVVDPR